MPASLIKLCRKCSTERPVAEFYVRKATGKLNPWCKQCYKDWYRSRGGYQHIAERACQWCNEPFTTARPEGVFCSRACKNKARQDQARQALEQSKPFRICLHCGAEMPRSMRAEAKFCSAACNSRAHQLQRKLRARGGPASTPGFVRTQIAERDRWRCGICGGSVSKERQYPDPLCGSLDHVVPVAEGGTSEPANLRLTHLSCNVRRRAGGGGEQLALT